MAKCCKRVANGSSGRCATVCWYSRDVDLVHRGVVHHRPDNCNCLDCPASVAVHATLDSSPGVHPLHPLQPTAVQLHTGSLQPQCMPWTQLTAKGSWAQQTGSCERCPSEQCCVVFGATSASAGAGAGARGAFSGCHSLNWRREYWNILQAGRTTASARQGARSILCGPGRLSSKRAQESP